MFGNITPRRTKRKRPKVVPAAVCEDAAYEELASSADAALSRLSDEITEVIFGFRNEVAGWPGSADVDEVDALLERLDEELTAAVRRARREALW
ncbi:MAG TPA: hypothetical protein PKD01_07330 [Mesorhizobium sp.]|nr:hypothetical protein [Mesorhizobium sp.]